MTADLVAPPGPQRYGAGLAVLVVGTGGEPFPSVADPAATRTAVVAVGEPSVLLVDSRPPDARPPAGDLPVLRIGEDVGRGAAVNRAVAALPAEVGLVAVAPPGLVWADGALDALCAAAARHPRAGVLAPRVRDPAGTAVASTHPLPRLARGVVAVLVARPATFARSLGGPVARRLRFRKARVRPVQRPSSALPDERLDPPVARPTSPDGPRGARPWPAATAIDPAAEAPVGWSSAPGLLLRRVALDSVDGFDPRYPGRLDDLDLADRLATAGWLTVHVPSATVVYAGPPRPDPTAARRYLSDRTARPVGALLRTAVP